MSRKQKRKNTKNSSNSFYRAGDKSENALSERSAHHSIQSSFLPDDAAFVLACIELDLKSTLSNKGASASNDKYNVDRKEAVLHPSDAYQVDVRDGESAVLVCSHENHDGQVAGDYGRDSRFIAAVCKVRIASGVLNEVPQFALRSFSPKQLKKKSASTARCGEIHLPSWLLEKFLSCKLRAVNPTAGASNSSLLPMSTNRDENKNLPKATSFASLSKPNGDLTISRDNSSRSSFSFAKGGRGDNFSSSHQIHTSYSAPCFKIEKESTKVLTSPKGVLVPLKNLTKDQRFCLCPDAFQLFLCPKNLADNAAPTKSFLSTSYHVIRTLITSKYQGTYVQSQSSVSSIYAVDDSTTTSSISDEFEALTISFRGQTLHFRIVKVTPSVNEETSSDGTFSTPDFGNDDKNYLSDGRNTSFKLNHANDNNDFGSASKSQLRLKKVIQSLVEAQNVRDASRERSVRIAYRITPKTLIQFTSSPEQCYSTEGTNFPSSDINDHTLSHPKLRQIYCVGLDFTLKRIKDALLPPLMNPDMFLTNGPLRPPRGALLFGPTGTGKSLLATQIAHDLHFANTSNDTPVYVRYIDCSDLLASVAIVGEAEKALSQIVEDAELRADDSNGALIILDDVHLICPRRGGVGISGGLGVDRLAGTLLALLDGIGRNSTMKGGVVILAITTDPSLLDSAIRRPGRLDFEVEVPVPDDKARAEILCFQLSRLETFQQNDLTIDAGACRSLCPGTKSGYELSLEEVEALARLAKGFTGADCKLAVKEAVRNAISRSLKNDCRINGAGFTRCIPNSVCLSFSDLEHAIRVTKPSAIKTISVEIPRVPWSSIGGMHHVKSLLRESIELPLTHPDLFDMMQVPPPKGILLYGPPGCSKTLMARAIATEGNMNFLAVKGPELLSKWLGESERALASLFRKARLASPAVIFFDEVDAIATSRGGGCGGEGERLLSQLLTELDGVTSGTGGNSGRVMVVGATNRPDVLDAALTRPGRIDRMIYVGLPDEDGRESIFEIGLRGKSCHEDVDTSILAKDDLSKGYTGAEIMAVCRDAALYAISEIDDGYLHEPKICMRHILRSIRELKPRTTPEMLKFYESFRGSH